MKTIHYLLRDLAPLVIVLAAISAITFITFHSAQAYTTSPPPPRAIVLSDIPVLTFHRGEMTAAQRSSPVPQLDCIGGSAISRTELRPTTVQCKNSGHDGHSVQWKCEAELDNSVRLGKVEVTCEGFRHSGDNLVLIGSCGLEYELNYTPAYLNHLESVEKQKHHYTPAYLSHLESVEKQRLQQEAQRTQPPPASLTASTAITKAFGRFLWDVALGGFVLFIVASLVVAWWDSLRSPSRGITTSTTTTTTTSSNPRINNEIVVDRTTTTVVPPPSIPITPIITMPSAPVHHHHHHHEPSAPLYPQPTIISAPSVAPTSTYSSSSYSWSEPAPFSGLATSSSSSATASVSTSYGGTKQRKDKDKSKKNQDDESDTKSSSSSNSSTSKSWSYGGSKTR
jgi:hypothetical protein